MVQHALPIRSPYRTPSAKILSYKARERRDGECATTLCHWSLSRLIELCGVRRSLPADAPLFVAGEAARRSYFLAAGLLRVVGSSLGGGRSVVASLGPGTFFAFGSGGTYEFTCEAVEPCLLVGFERRRLEALAASDPALRQVLADTARRELEWSSGLRNH